MDQKRNPKWTIFRTLSILGPGVIAASSGNDAGGIATYASIGSQFGFSLLWVLFLILTPGLIVVQLMSIRLGVVTGKGLTALIRERFNLQVGMLGVISLFLSNSIIAISEFFGIAAALELFHIPRIFSAPVAGVVVWILIVRGTYQRVEKLFLLLSTLFLSYIAASLAAKPNWHEVFSALVIPSFQLNGPYLTLFVATIATTITPYMQIYAQSSVVEKGLTTKDLHIVELDAIIGSIFSNVISIFIVITTAATLFPAQVHIDSAADAARALQPLVGKYSSVLFGLGLLGASTLAAGVLPLTTAFSTCEAFGWRSGVQYTYRQAPIFYSIFTLLIILGVIITMLPGIPLIQLLIGAYVLNGIFLPIELIYMLKLANDKELMNTYVNGATLNITTLAVIVIVSLAVILMMMSFFPFQTFLHF